MMQMQQPDKTVCLKQNIADLVAEPISKSDVNFLDDVIIEECQGLGYAAPTLRRYLRKNELNNATTTYYLLQAKLL